MKLKSFFKRLILTEEKIVQVFSPINGEILVYEDLFGKYSMRIGGVSQSGGLVVDIWKKAIEEIRNLKLEIRNCLILGLGCGNSAGLVSQKWPSAKITGVEIDPVVMEVGEKYFGLRSIKNLTIVIGDALIPTSYKLIPTNFDLVLIDLYLGQNFPKQAESEKFISDLKDILNKEGIVVFNRFNWGQYRNQARDFEQKLKHHFAKVWSKKTVSNLLLFCQG